jgi:tetratricopeptide (TPR) repeat protein
MHSWVRMRTHTFWMVCLAVSGCGGSPARRAAADDATAVADALIRGDYELALERADEELRKHPRDLWLRYDRGVALAALGETDKALVELKAAEGALPIGDVHRRAVATYRRALIHEAAGHCGAASAELSHYAELVTKTDPVGARAALARVDLCIGPTPIERERAAEATTLEIAVDDTAKQRAIAASTESVRALTEGDARKALEFADIGLAYSPRDPQLLYDRGRALGALGKTRESLRTLEDAERYSPSDDVRTRRNAIYARALTFEHEGRCEESRREFQSYVDLVRDEPNLGKRVRTHLATCRQISKVNKGD